LIHNSLKNNIENKEARIENIQHMIVDIKGNEPNKEDGQEPPLSNGCKETKSRKSNTSRMRISRVPKPRNHKENSDENKESKP
jgi:hypothetical protein